MLDLSHIPSTTESTYTFYATGNWQTFTKPRNAKFIQIFCLGGGGGGAAPNAGTNPNGAAGGGAGGIVRGIIPAFLLPDTLYILVGKGGIGGKINSAAGSTGGISYISLDGTTTEQTLICKSSTAGAVGGGVGTITIGGPAATISVPSLSAFGNLALLTAVAGVAGSTGGTNTPTSGSSQTALATNIVTGGAGGAGKQSLLLAPGGNINSGSVLLTSTVLGGQTDGANGANGYGTLSPFCGTGGAGGGSSVAKGGNGGNGFYGCGGGGAGGSATGNVSLGGDGGDGLVIITVIS